MTATASNLVNGRKTYLDQNGAPLAGGQVFYYAPGTTTPVTVWLDDAMTTPASSPIILDAAGSCVAFAVGEIREYVLDALDNLISDSVTVASTPLFISAAMLPVLEAPTVAAAEALLVAASNGFTNLNIDPGDQTLNVAPTANPPNTRASLNVQGTTLNANTREFLVDFGLTSSVGAGGTAGNDKVTLYSGMDATAGTSDVWSLNTVVTMEAGSGNYNAQGYELDFNNLNANRGSAGNLISDYTAPVANGLSITGAGDFSSTTGMFVNSVENGNPVWNRGITTAGTMGHCGYQEWSTAPVGIQFDGAYSIAAINLVSLYGNAGAVATTGLFLKNSQAISWQSENTQGVQSITTDIDNNMFIGASAPAGTTANVIMGASTIPQTTGAQLLGGPSNRWGDAYLGNVRIPNTFALTWDNNPAANSGIAAFVSDFVDNSNNRAVGGGAAAIFMGAVTAPITANLDLGTTINTWGTIYSSVGVTIPSDMRLKDNVRPLARMTDHVDHIEPIAFTWKDGRDDKFHLGFDAEDIRTNLGADFGGYHEADGTQFLIKDELIAVLWQAVRELSERVSELESR